MAEIASNNDLAHTPTEDNLPIHIHDAIDAEHEVDGDKAPSTSTDDTSVHEPSTPPPVQVAEPVKAATDASPSKAPVQVKKSVMSVSPVKKTNGGPPTPTVKKIINSGTFGAGSVKPTVAKGAPSTAPAAATAKVAAPPLRKTTSPPTVSKPVLASSTSAKPPLAVTVTARRASVVPTRPTAPPVKTSLSASAAKARPAAEGSVRSSVVSPTGSVGSAKAAPIARPRASVSEAVRKAPLSSRPSVTGTARPTAAVRAAPPSRTSVVAPAAKSARAASISSIREVKEDDKALSELQTRLEEATKVLEEKNATVSDLGEQLAKLEASLGIASETSESRLNTIKETEEAKAALEAQLEDTRNGLEKSQQQLAEITASFQAAQAELESSKAAASASSDIIANLNAQIQALEESLVFLKEEVAALKEDSTEASALQEAASIEREALLKARSDLSAISTETEALKAAHTTALQESEQQIAELSAKLAETKSLESQLTALKAEREENANKLSELEIEILELKEAQDALEDTRDSLRQQVANLEDDLAKAAVAGAMAAESSATKDVEHSNALAELAAKHEKELEVEAARYAGTVASLEALKTELSSALAAHEQSKQDLLDKEEKHAAKLATLEEASAASQASLSEELLKVTKELESQEAIYNAKVDKVKAEHTQLLEEAYEKAKSDAATEHSQELQAFRASSNVTIEEIKSANKIALDSIKADYASSLESEVSGLQKQISKLKLELKATQDDLSKAKTSLEASRAEVESLTQQRDAALVQAEAAPTSSPEQLEELKRLQNELSSTKDDLKVVTDMLALTKTSMTELSDRQGKELEEAAQGRADEILKLRAAHDEEVTTFATAKSELLIRLSDMEGELASARAALAAQQTASPKSNSNGPTPSTSFATKEELTKLHEAHNLKMNDLQAAHDKALKLVKDELEAARGNIEQLTKDISHRDMEIGYMRTDQEESEETIARLKADIDALTGQS